MEETPKKVAFNGQVKIKDVSAGGRHSLFLVENGEVWATGFNGMGQLGIGSLDPSVYPPRKMLGIDNVKMISAGFEHSLLLAVDGNGTEKVFGTGSNRYGELGMSDSDYILQPTEVESGLVQSLSVTQLLASKDFSLVLGKNSTLVSMGKLSQFGPQFAREKFPYSFHHVRQSSAGDGFSVIIDSNHDLYATGRNDKGQLGLGHYNNVKLLSKVTNLSRNKIEKVVYANTGKDHMVVLAKVKGEGRSTLFTVGDNAYGQLGRNTGNEKKDNILKKATYKTTSDFADISAGGFHSLVLATDGLVYLAGCQRMDCEVKYTFEQLKKVKRIVQISTGLNHSALLTENGKVLTFGDNSWGQLGRMTTNEYSSNPKQMQIDVLDNSEDMKESEIIQVSCGSRHTIILTKGGKVFMSGDSQHFQLCRQDNFIHHLPIEISLEKKIAQISAGYYHSAFIDEDGDIRACGGKEFLFASSGEVVHVSNRSKCSSVSAGNDHLLSICQGIAMECPNGYYVKSLVCKPCSKGYYCKGLTKERCDKGTGANGRWQWTCEACKEGYYSNDEESPCKPCPPGYFQKAKRSVMCDICPRNTYAQKKGSKECVPISNNVYFNETIYVNETFPGSSVPFMLKDIEDTNIPDEPKETKTKVKVFLRVLSASVGILSFIFTLSLFLCTSCLSYCFCGFRYLRYWDVFYQKKHSIESKQFIRFRDLSRKTVVGGLVSCFTVIIMISVALSMTVNHFLDSNQQINVDSISFEKGVVPDSFSTQLNVTVVQESSLPTIEHADDIPNCNWRDASDEVFPNYSKTKSWNCNSTDWKERMSLSHQLSINSSAPLKQVRVVITVKSNQYSLEFSENFDLYENETLCKDNELSVIIEARRNHRYRNGFFQFLGRLGFPDKITQNDRQFYYVKLQDIKMSKCPLKDAFQQEFLAMLYVNFYRNKQNLLETRTVVIKGPILFLSSLFSLCTSIIAFGGIIVALIETCTKKAPAKMKLSTIDDLDDMQEQLLDPFEKRDYELNDGDIGKIENHLKMEDIRDQLKTLQNETDFIIKKLSDTVSLRKEIDELQKKIPNSSDPWGQFSP